jgi:transcriptional regulator of NAD metabolism
MRKAKLGKKEGSNMKVNEIGIHAGDSDHPYRTVGEISAKLEAATRFSKTPTLEDINLKLQEKASQLGANAVIKVEYNRNMSQASGVAVVLESDEVNWVTEFLEYQR